jgi:hypothetical protein
MRRLLLGLALAALAALPGCSAPRSRVHGTVKYQGKPLAGAVLTFFGPDNMVYSADTRPDGTYAIEGVPRGAIRVSVQVPPPRPKPRPDPDFVAKARKGAAPAAGAKADSPAPPASDMPPRVNLPTPYGDPNTSGLAFELKEADQDYSPELK